MVGTLKKIAASLIMITWSFAGVQEKAVLLHDISLAGQIKKQIEKQIEKQKEKQIEKQIEKRHEIKKRRWKEEMDLKKKMPEH